MEKREKKEKFVDLNDKNKFNYVEHIYFRSSNVIILVYIQLFCAWQHERIMRAKHACLCTMFQLWKVFVSITFEILLPASMQTCDLMWF